MLLSKFDALVLFHNRSTITLRHTRRDAACCLDRVPWRALETFTANGNIHRSSWFDERISSVTKLMAAGIPLAHPVAWAALTAANSGDAWLWEELLADSRLAPGCNG